MFYSHVWDHSHFNMYGIYDTYELSVFVSNGLNILIAVVCADESCLGF